MLFAFSPVVDPSVGNSTEGVLGHRLMLITHRCNIEQLLQC